MNNKKKTILIVALLLVVFIGSISYALWSVTLEQTDSNIVKTGCFTVDMVEQTDEINLPEEYPVTDAEGRKYSPFTFTIQNTCTIDSSYSVNLKVDSSSTLEHQYVKAVLDGDKAQVLTDYKKATDEDKYQLTTGTLAGASAEGAGDGESVTYNLRLWLDADTPETQMSKDFYAKIVIENITTSGVVAKEVLATGDISETENDNVTYTYYSTGEIQVTGTGRMAVGDSGLLVTISPQIMANEKLVAKLTEEEKTVLNSEMGRLAFAPLNQNYSSLVNLAGITCETEPIDMNSYVSCLQSAGITDSNFYSLMDKVGEVFKPISKITLSEGITNISDSFFGGFKLASVTLPSTILEIGIAAFTDSEVGELNLNEGLKKINRSAFNNAKISKVEIPYTVTEIGSAFGRTKDMTVKLPKNNTYTALWNYDFENAENLILIIPDTITNIPASAFSGTKNLTLNFECSEEEASEIVANLKGGSIDAQINYNYDYDAEL